MVNKMIDPELLILPKKDPNPIAKVQEIAYLKLSVRDLSKSISFYTDFGLRVVHTSKTEATFSSYNRNSPCLFLQSGNKDQLIGLGFFIDSNIEFSKLQESLNGELLFDSEFFKTHPILKLRDPSGLPIDIILSDEWKEQEVNNYSHKGIKKTERQNIGFASKIEKPKVLRLGHAVLQRVEYIKNMKWYCHYLGLIPSDTQVLKKSKAPVLSFLRCDRGNLYTDHHTLVLAQGLSDKLEHYAFELESLDSVGKAKEYIKSKGWNSAWGIGRHILGSQIFDYLRDPSGLLVEHYCDGDRFDSSIPMGIHSISRKGLYIWGEDHPQDFLDLNISLSKLIDVLLSLWKRKQFSLKLIFELKSNLDEPARDWLRR